MNIVCTTGFYTAHQGFGLRRWFARGSRHACVSDKPVPPPNLVGDFDGGVTDGALIAGGVRIRSVKTGSGSGRTPGRTLRG
jgi:hypothetical protein